MSLALLLVSSSNCAMRNLFPCELQRPKQQYENALRIWGQVEFPVPNGPWDRQRGKLSGFSLSKEP
jgi:hypothetical protein